MKKITLALLPVLWLGLGSPLLAAEDERLKAVIAGDQRTAEEKARDGHGAHQDSRE